MKKIVSAVAAASLLAGAAFAEFTVTGNARVYSDVVNYTSPSRSTQNSDTDGNGTDDNGTLIMAKDTKHADDVTIQAKGDKSGIKIVFNVTSAADNAKTDVNLTSYQLWVTDLFGLRLDAGAYDQRLAQNLNNDGNWGTNLSGSYKPGLINDATDASGTAISDLAYGKDAANITAIKGDKTYTNFQVSKKINDALTVRGVMFLSKNGTSTNGTSTTHDEKWIFTPFAVGGTYQLDGDTKLNFNAKLSSITHGSKKETAESTSWVKTNTYSSATAGEDGYTTIADTTKKVNGTVYDAEGNALTDTNGCLTEYAESIGLGKKGDQAYTKTKTVEAADSTTEQVVMLTEVTTPASTSYTPDKSVWTLNANLYKKLSDALEIEAGYTLGASLYSNWSGYGAHKNDRLVRDYDVFAHGFDFRAKDKLSDQLSLTAVANVTYVQASAAAKSTAQKTSVTGTYKDARARDYDKGAAGTLAYFATLSVDYKQSDLMTFQIQTKLENTNLFAATKGDSSKYHADYYKNLSWIIRPGVQIAPDKNSQFFAGVQFQVDGFLRNATGKNNTVKTTTSIPIGLRVKL